MPTAADYDALEVIGQGSFGSIRKVRRKVDGVIMARKEIRYEKMEAKERDQLTSEFSILSALRHPNIVEYHHREHVKEHQMVYIYMEYCGGGDLSGLLKDLRKKGTSLREDVIWSIFVQLVSALYRCHYGVDPPENPPNTRSQAPPTHTRGNTVIHRDLKPENVFLDENNLVKLGDFGLSKMLGSEHQMAMTYVGTPLYMSPELVSDTPYTVKTDIWSLGCIMYELCTLKPPFTAKTPHQLFHTIKQGRFDPIPNYYSAELRAAIEQCLRCEPKERPEASQLLFMPPMQIYRKQRDMVLLRKQLQVKENILNTRESRIIAKEREIENRLVAKNNALIARERELMGKEGELIAKERELMAKEQELMIKERDMRQILEERSHSIREHIDMELRNEWTIKAEIEVMQQVEIQKMNLESQFEFEVNQRVEAQVRQRVEEQLSHRVEMEVERRMAGLNLVPAQIASLHSAHSSSTSSQQSAETSITSVHSSFRSPARRGLVPLGAPDSPNDVDMASPARDQEPIPTNPDNVFEGKPQGQGLRQSLFQKQLLDHRYSDPNPLANTNMNDLLDESEDETEHFRKSENSTPLLRVAETGSPFKRDVGPIRRSKTTTAVNLFPTAKRTSLGPDEFNMLKTATTNSLNQNENPLRGKAIFELAKRRDEELKSSRTTPREEVATWDPEKDEMPSPFMVRTRRDYPI